MSSRIQLIVGLANPGKKYADTRHNAGAWFVEYLTSQDHITLRQESKFHGLYGTATLADEPVHLLIPSTYMNLSGQAVSSLMRYRKIAPNEVLVVHDEIDLPVGSIKLKFDGGDGGHNGLKDIIEHLSSRQFHRLRIGVGHPGHRDQVVDYVLTNPSKHDRLLIDGAIERAYDTLPLIVAGSMQKAMQQLHSGE